MRLNIREEFREALQEAGLKKMAMEPICTKCQERYSGCGCGDKVQRVKKLSEKDCSGNIKRLAELDKQLGNKYLHHDKRYIVYVQYVQVWDQIRKMESERSPYLEPKGFFRKRCPVDNCELILITNFRYRPFNPIEHLCYYCPSCGYVHTSNRFHE